MYLQAGFTRSNLKFSLVAVYYLSSLPLLCDVSDRREVLHSLILQRVELHAQPIGDGPMKIII